jgi:hypothetical protein
MKPGTGENWLSCAACARKYSYQIVDKIIPGPGLDDNGRFISTVKNVFGSPAKGGLSRLLYRGLPTAGSCLKYAYVGIELFDAVSGKELKSASFRVDNETSKHYYPQAGKLSNLGPEGFGEGFPQLQGTHIWRIESAGYTPYDLQITIGPVSDTYYFPVYMVPADGLTRAVIRWGDTPADLDLYIIPIGVVDIIGSPVEWASRKIDGTIIDPPRVNELGQNPYLWWGVTPEEDCTCEMISVPCTPTCNLLSLGTGDVIMTLDRYVCMHVCMYVCMYAYSVTCCRWGLVM